VRSNIKNSERGTGSTGKKIAQKEIETKSGQKDQTKKGNREKKGNALIKRRNSVELQKEGKEKRTGGQRRRLGMRELISITTESGGKLTGRRISSS